MTTKLQAADAAVSDAYRQLLISVLKEFLEAKVILFCEFKKKWRELDVYRGIWKLFPTRPQHRVESFVVFVFDGGTIDDAFIDEMCCIY